VQKKRARARIIAARPGPARALPVPLLLFAAECSGTNVGVCQSHDTGSDTFRVGTASGAIEAQDDNSFVLTYKDGSSESCNSPRVSRFIFECDEGAPYAIKFFSRPFFHVLVFSYTHTHKKKPGVQAAQRQQSHPFLICGCSRLTYLFHLTPQP